MEIENLNDEENAMAKTRKNDPKTYAAKTPDGRTVRCTVPESDNREWPELLVDAITENLSPQAVVSIVVHLDVAHAKDANVNREVAWFADLLRTMIAPDEFNRIMEEVGL